MSAFELISEQEENLTLFYKNLRNIKRTGCFSCWKQRAMPDFLDTAAKAAATAWLRRLPQRQKQKAPTIKKEESS